MSNTSRSAVCIMISLLLSAFASCGHQPRFASIMVTSTGIEPSPRLSSTVSQALDSLQAVAHSVAPSEDTRIDFSPSGKAAIATYRTRVGGFVWPDWRIAGPLALPENTKQAYFASDDYVWYTESDGTVTLASLARPREGIVLTTPCTLRQVFVVEAEEVLALTQDGRLLSASLGSGLLQPLHITLDGDEVGAAVALMAWHAPSRTLVLECSNECVVLTGLGLSRARRIHGYSILWPSCPGGQLYLMSLAGEIATVTTKSTHDVDAEIFTLYDGIECRDLEALRTLQSIRRNDPWMPMPRAMGPDAGDWAESQLVQIVVLDSDCQ